MIRGRQRVKGVKDLFSFDIPPGGREIVSRKREDSRRIRANEKKME